MTKHSLEANKEDSSVHVSCHDQSVHVGDDVSSYVQPGSNAPNSKIVNSCSTIHNLARITFAPCKNTRATNSGIWSSFILPMLKDVKLVTSHCIIDTKTQRNISPIPNRHTC